MVTRSRLSGLLCPPRPPRKTWEGYPILLAWGSRLAVATWKNVPPQAFATGLPETTVCFLPCRNTAETALLTRTKTCFSRFLRDCDLHIGPLGGLHGVQMSTPFDVQISAGVFQHEGSRGGLASIIVMFLFSDKNEYCTLICWWTTRGNIDGDYWSMLEFTF